MKKSISAVLSILLTVVFAVSAYASISIQYTFYGTMEGDDQEYIFHFGSFEGDDVTEVGIEAGGKNYQVTNKADSPQLDKALASKKFGIGLADPKNILGESFIATPYFVSAGVTETGTSVEINKAAIGGVPEIADPDTLKTVTVNGSPLAKFQPNTTSYKIPLSSEVTQVPEIGYTLTDSSSTAVVNKAEGIPGRTKIIVTDKDGASKTYTFDFLIQEKVTANIIKAAQSSPTTVAERVIGGSTTTHIMLRRRDSGFVDNVTQIGFLRFQLSQALPENSTLVGAELYVTLAQTAGFAPKYRFCNALPNWDEKLPPQAGESFPFDSEVDLGSISDETIPPFNQPKYNGSTIPLNQDELIITNGTTIDLATYIDLISDAVYGYLYVGTKYDLPQVDLYYVMEPQPDDNTISSITVNGTIYNNFDPAKTTQRIILPYGTTAAPEIDYHLTSYKSNAVVTQASTLTDAATIVVTAENGEEKTYTFNFVVPQKVTVETTKASQITRSGSPTTPILATSGPVGLRAYNTSLSSNSTSFGLFRFELEGVLPDDATIVNAEFTAGYARSNTTGYTPIISFYNADTNWDTFNRTEQGNGPIPINLATLLGTTVAMTDLPVYTVASYPVYTTSLDRNSLMITNDKKINIGVASSFFDISAYAYIGLQTKGTLPKVSIYYLTKE